jgi:NitT/TauT family transport system substrate-binding protein
MARRLILISLLAILSFTLPVTELTAAEKIKWGVHFKRNPYYGMPALAAEDKGFWKEQGLEAEVVEFASAGLLERAFAAGALDIGTSGITGTALYVSRGGPEVIVADPKMQVDFVLWALADSPINRAQDLKNAKIGVSRFGLTPHVLAQKAVRLVGAEPTAKFLALGGGAPAIAALKLKRVDTLAFSNFTLLSLLAKKEVKMAVNLTEFVPGAKISGAQVISAHRDYAKNNRAAVKKAVRAFMRAAGFVLKNRDWTIEKMVNYHRFSKEAAGLAFNQFRYGPDARLDIKKIEAGLNFLIESKLLAKEKAPALERLYVTGFDD